MVGVAPTLSPPHLPRCPSPPPHPRRRAAPRPSHTLPYPPDPAKISPPRTAMAASAAPLRAALAVSPPAAAAARPSPAFLSLPLPPCTRCLRLSPAVLISGRGRMIKEDATVRTRQEKEQQEAEVAAVEDSFAVREAVATPPPEEEGGFDEELNLAGEDDDWVVRLEQSFNIFLTDTVILILDILYRDRDYARFFVLETIAGVPYFAFISVLHLYETFGWSRRADNIKVHFAESMNEFHHLLIMESMAIQSALASGMGGAGHAVARWPCTVFMFGAMSCLSVSTAAHLLACHSRRSNRLFWQLNYAGYDELFSRYIDDPDFQFKYENDTPHIKVIDQLV